jgi:hypothetical protein
MSVLINTRWKIWTFWETNKKQTTKNFPFHPDGFLTTENSVCVYVTLEEMRPIKSLKNWLYLKAFYHTWCLLFRASSIDPAAAHLQQSGSIFFYPRFFLGLTVHVLLPLWNISNHFSFPFFFYLEKKHKGPPYVMAGGQSRDNCEIDDERNPSTILPATDRN